jgi:hypothetical protein
MSQMGRSPVRQDACVVLPVIEPCMMFIDGFAVPWTAELSSVAPGLRVVAKGVCVYIMVLRQPTTNGVLYSNPV